MVRKARPQLSVHIRRQRNRMYLIRNLPQGHFHLRPHFEKYQKSSADENNAMMRNARQEYVIIRILFASERIKTSHSAVYPKLPTGTVSFGSLPLVTLCYLSHSAYFTYTRRSLRMVDFIWDKYVLLRPLRWMMKPLAAAPLEQRSESSTIVFLVPDDVWHTGPRS